MTASTFLFCDTVSPERLRWFSETVASVSVRPGRPSSDPENLTVFLTGDSLFSLIDTQTRSIWQALAAHPSVQIVADGDELLLHGLSDTVSVGSPGVTIVGGSQETGGAFWQILVSTLKDQWTGTPGAAFLLCQAPYMSRTSVYMLRFLAGTQAAGLHPELYAYLDGVHTLHNGQRPSEFENIGRGVAAIAGAAVQSGRDPWFAACSRCATARGYYQMNPGTGFCEPASCIDDITIRSLKDILGRFHGRHPVLSHMGGGIVPDENNPEEASEPRLVVFITCPPYCTEWTFGGLSLALAAAMDGIPTSVIFIEQGVYALYGTHEVPRHDKLFNIQEMLAATTDVSDLRYLVHRPSLEQRGIEASEQFPMIPRVGNRELAEILWGTTHENPFSATRVIFF
jgi:sulfur relay (sulfurtransferase) DsrF/TusC family protein